MKKASGIWSEPSYTHLKEFLNHLPSICGVNSSHTAECQLQLLKIAAKDVGSVIPTLIYLYSWMRHDCSRHKNWNSYFSPAEKNTLYPLVTRALNIHPDNTLDDASCFSKLIHFIRLISDTEAMQEHSVRAISLAIEAKKRCKNDIQSLMHRFPAHSVLKNNLSTLKKNYQPEQHGFFDRLRAPNQKRLQALQFLSALNEKIGDSCTHADYLLRCGALLYVMHTIEAEYKYRSPTNSKLYCAIQDVTGLRSTADLCFELKQALLTQLNALLCGEHLDQESLIFWEDSGIDHAALQKAEAEIVTYHAQLIKFRNRDFACTPAANDLINDFLDCISRTLAQTGVIFACVQIARFCAASSLSPATFLAIASPENAALLMGSLWLIAQCRSSLNSYATQTTQNFISPLLCIPMQALTRNKSLLDHLDEQAMLSPTESLLLQALYAAPAEVVTDREKKRLENIFPADILSGPEEEKCYDGDENAVLITTFGNAAPFRL